MLNSTYQELAKAFPSKPANEGISCDVALLQKAAASVREKLVLGAVTSKAPAAITVAVMKGCFCRMALTQTIETVKREGKRVGSGQPVMPQSVAFRFVEVESELAALEAFLAELLDAQQAYNGAPVAVGSLLAASQIVTEKLASLLTAVSHNESVAKPVRDHAQSFLSSLVQLAEGATAFAAQNPSEMLDELTFAEAIGVRNG